MNRAGGNFKLPKREGHISNQLLWELNKDSVWLKINVLTVQ